MGAKTHNAVAINNIVGQLTMTTKSYNPMTTKSYNPMTTKSYTRRDSATAVLRKLGVAAQDYNNFIIQNGGKFIVDMSAVDLYLKPSKTAKSEAKSEAKSGPKVKRNSVSQIIRDMILSGMTNQEIWDVLEQQHGFDNSKRHYPAWYRAEMRRTGKLTTSQI